MSKDQHKFLKQWLVILIAFSPLLIFYNTILDKWESIKWPGSIVMLVLISLLKDKKNIADTRNIQEYSKDHPWVVIYLAVFSFIVVSVSIYVISTGARIESHGLFLFWAFSLLIVPPVIGQQIERFKELGQKPNH